MPGPEPTKVCKEDPPWYEFLFSCLCDNPVREGALVAVTEKRIRRERAVEKLGARHVNPDHISFVTVHERGRNGPISSNDLMREQSIPSGSSSEVGVSDTETESMLDMQKSKDETISTKCCGIFNYRGKKWKA